MIEYYNIDFNKFDYLLPPEKCLDYEHLKISQVINISNDIIKERLSYYSKELFLTEIEVEFLEIFDNICNEHNIKIPIFWKVGDKLKLIHLSNLKKDQLLENIIKNVNFINNWENNTFTNINDIIINGIVYIFGRDKYYSPNIYINLKKYNENKIKEQDFIITLSFILRFTKASMMLPDFLEKWNIFIDINGISIFKINTDLIKNIITNMNLYFNGHLKHLFIVNGGSLFNMIWSGISSFINQNTRKKIINVSNISDLLNYTNKDNLEIIYGGDIDLKGGYWPPRETNKSLQKINLLKYLKDDNEIFYFDNYHYNIIHKQPLLKKINTISDNIFKSYEKNNVISNKLLINEKSSNNKLEINDTPIRRKITNDLFSPSFKNNKIFINNNVSNSFKNNNNKSLSKISTKKDNTVTNNASNNNEDESQFENPFFDSNIKSISKESTVKNIYTSRKINNNEIKTNKKILKKHSYISINSNNKITKNNEKPNNNINNNGANILTKDTKEYIKYLNNKYGDTATNNNCLLNNILKFCFN